jgi:tetratricopeptide (TPR) repeat protein
VLDVLDADQAVRQHHQDVWPLLAMANHHLGRTVEAEESFNRFVQALGGRADWFARVPVVGVCSQLLGQEAEQLIANTTNQTDARINNLYEQRELAREQFDIDTEAFDAAILFFQKKPHLYIARGQRLAELGRFEDARADFDRASELARDDPEVSTARLRSSQMLLLAGGAKLNAGEFAAALQNFESVIEQLQGLSPFPDVAAYAEQLRSVAWLLSGDLESHQRRCRELVEQYGDSQDLNHLRTIVGCCKQHPESVEDWGTVIRCAELVARRAPPEDPWGRWNVFLILCRAGRPEEAFRCVPDIIQSDNGALYLFAALAKAQLGEIEEAEKLLASWEAWLATDEVMPLSLWFSEERYRAGQVREMLAAAKSTQTQSQDQPD